MWNTGAARNSALNQARHVTQPITQHGDKAMTSWLDPHHFCFWSEMALFSTASTILRTFQRKRSPSLREPERGSDRPCRQTIERPRECVFSARAGDLRRTCCSSLWHASDGILSCLADQRLSWRRTKRVLKMRSFWKLLIIASGQLTLVPAVRQDRAALHSSFAAGFLRVPGTASAA